MSLSNHPNVLGGGATSVNVNGGTGLFADGSASTPSISFVNDSDTGFFVSAANITGFAAGGSAALRFGNSGGGFVSGASGGQGNISFPTAGGVTIAAAGTNQNITFTPSGTGAVVVPSAVTSGIQLYNTADQTTNYERLEALWSSNRALISTVTGGTGTGRELVLRAQNSSGGAAFSAILLNVPAAPYIRHGLFNGSFAQASTTGTGTYASFGNVTHTGTSGSVVSFAITPTYNQASGTAANTDCLVNRTETAVGSGTQNLLDLQVGGTSRFAVRNTGAVVMANQTSGPGVATGTLTNAPSAGDPDFWLPISINGTAHWIPAWAA